MKQPEAQVPFSSSLNGTVFGHSTSTGKETVESAQCYNVIDLGNLYNAQDMANRGSTTHGKKQYSVVKIA